MDAGETLTDTITITSLDGTPHDITLTISGNSYAPVITSLTGHNLTALSEDPEGTESDNLEGLNAGSIDNQNGWVLERFNTSSSIFVEDGFGADGSKAMKFTAGGPGVGNSASRVNSQVQTVPDLTDARSMVVEVDIHKNAWGVMFGLGADVNDDGQIARAATEEHGVKFSFNRLWLADGSSVSFSGVGGGWSKYRLEIDLEANNGQGSGTLMFRNLTAGESEWTTLPELTNINLALNPLANDARNPENWDGVYLHMEGGTGGLDNINIQTLNPGDTVGQIITDGSFTDADTTAVEAIAITSVDNSNGTWEYSIDNGVTWIAINDGSLADDHALLMAATDKVRFVPNEDYNGNADFTFRAWDQSTGTTGTYADASINGGSTAFSTETATAAITISPTNDAPTSTDSTITVSEDGTHGFTAADFNFRDVDGDAFHSVTITQLPTAGTLYQKPRPDLEFTFSDSSDPANDARNNINGSLTGATQVSDPEQGDVLSFSDPNDRIELDQAFNLGSEWTISARFKDLYLENGLWNTLTRGSSTDHQIIFHDTTGELGTYTAAGFSGTGFMASEIGDGWHEITAVGKDGKTYFYLDDTFVGVADDQSTSDVFAIGNYQNNPQPFAEFLDDFQIKNTALLPDLDLNSLASSSSPSLQFDFSDSTNPAYDPNQGITSTLNGATWVNDAQHGPAMQFDSEGDYIILDDPINVGSEWTISTRFKNPAALNNGDQYGLVRNNSDIHVIIHTTGELGVLDRLPSNTFIGSGFNMSTLDNNWHTITAVGKGGKTYFYLMMSL